MKKGSGTRSGLLWEVERLLTELRDSNSELPQVLVMENVTQVHSAKNIDDFKTWLSFLSSLGYSNHFNDMNAKDYGTAQNRNRTFMVSILGEYDFDFPKPITLRKRMKDYLEDKVDEKYYINNDKAKALILNLIEKGVLPPTTDNRQQTTDNRQQIVSASTCVSSQEKSRFQVVSVQDTIQESKFNINLRQAEFVKSKCPISVNYNFVEKTNLQVAKTLCARDYKGFTTGFQMMNGVLEKNDTGLSD